MKIEDFIEERGKNHEGRMSVVFFSLFVITNRIETTYNGAMDELSLKQLMLLILVSISPGENFTRLGQVMGSSRQNIKTLAEALEKKSFVRIEKDEEDRRAYGVYPSQKAKDHFDQTDQNYSQQILALFSSFSEEEVQLLFNLVPKFFQGIERMEADKG